MRQCPFSDMTSIAKAAADMLFRLSMAFTGLSGLLIMGSSIASFIGIRPVSWSLLGAALPMVVVGLVLLLLHAKYEQQP
jgi:hypothetical protein